MLEALVDTILPATDTPGARQARVQVFVDLALRDCYTPAEQQLFVAGLEALAGECRPGTGGPSRPARPKSATRSSPPSMPRATRPTRGRGARSSAS